MLTFQVSTQYPLFTSETKLEYYDLEVNIPVTEHLKTEDLRKLEHFKEHFNSLNMNPTKWSNTLKRIV